MKRRSRRFFGCWADAGRSILRRFGDGPTHTLGAAATAWNSGVETKSAEINVSSDDALDTFSEPFMVLDGGGNIVAANAAARDLVGPHGTAIQVEQVLAKVRIANGGGTPPWVPVSATDGYDAIVQSPEHLIGQPIFELKTVERASVGGNAAGWIVRLVEITPLIAALRSQRLAADHLNQLLKLLSHDMRAPLAAILTTLRHPDLGAMPATPRRIIEKAAYRALHMVDYNARLIRAQSSEYTFVALNLVHVMEEVFDAVWSMSKAADVRLVLEQPDEELLILADRGSLTEALTELCRQLLNASRVNRTLLCKLSATTLNDHPAVTLSVAEVYQKLDDRARLNTARDLASHFDQEILQSDDNDAVAFLRIVVTRHSGTATLKGEPGFQRTASITIPTIDPAALRS